MEANPVIKLSSQEFIERIVSGKKDGLVKITSAWSGTGQLLGNVFEDLAAQFTNVNFYSIEYDVDSAIVVTYRVEAVPSILFFKNGTLVDKLSGLTQKSIISNKIDAYVNK